jgi:hypothetical protein
MMPCSRPIPDLPVFLTALNRLLFGGVSSGALSLAARGYRRGDRPGARRFLAIAAGAAPHDCAVQDSAAQLALKASDSEAALPMLESVLRLWPGDPGVPLMSMVAALRMPGPNYVEVLKAIHAELRPRTYLEIGVSRGTSIALAGPETRAIGVDPAPELSQPLRPGTVIHTETSDDFFARHDVRALLGGPVELGFIDGMHRFEFALRDLLNMERLCTAQSTILIHDCYPLERRSAERERCTEFWTGDIWRLVLALKKYRPDLRIHTIAAAPSGLCVVRGLDPASTVLAERCEAIVAEFMALDFGVLAAGQADALNLTPNDPRTLRRILHYS